jgi:ABC-type Fe3+/spermidine/putrescine transport system ATPase subunit
VVLLDEPFSNLDAQLREGTRLELRRIQQELGLTALFVTHDQAEAMSISDRVAIMRHGRIEQIDTPRNVYTRPATRFVASFVGKANILEARLLSRGPEGALYDAGGLQCLARAPGSAEQGNHAGGNEGGTEGGMAGAIVLRPELIRLQPPGAAPNGPNRVAGTVGTVSYSGPVAQLEIAIAGGRSLIAEGPGSLPLEFPPGSPVSLEWRPEDLVLCTR